VLSAAWRLGTGRKIIVGSALHRVEVKDLKSFSEGESLSVLQWQIRLADFHLVLMLSLGTS